MLFRSPPAHQYITTDKTNILIRTLTQRRGKDTLAGNGAASQQQKLGAATTSAQGTNAPARPRLPAFGGTGAEARYEGASESFTLTLTADSPLVAQMSAMLGNAMVMAQMGGKIVRVGRLKFLDQDGSMMGLVGNRVLVQITGASNEVMLPLLEQIDFAALEGFGN